jgi:hypothetical protein
MTQYTDDRFNGRPTTPLRVFKRDGTAVEFDTPFASLAEACDVLRGLGNAFATSLVSAVESVRGPSNKQAAWVHKLATEAITPRAPRLELDVQLQPVVAMLQRAADAQKRAPRIVLERDGQQVQLRLGRRSGELGPVKTVNVTDGRPYGDNTWFGRISTDGQFRASDRCTPIVLQLLRDLAADPAKVAGQHGVATGSCCFCRRALSDKRSRTVGYGPDCAAKYNLPWGDTSAADAADAAAKEAL